MNAVNIFNDELHSLLATRPPVSKGKIEAITRAALEGVKFYKHIVLSVEKFITKCRPEYKLPALYVIDSIVRQSRRQFGTERNVYAIRFSRNLHLTFEYLFTGTSTKDKDRIVRVLNLWRKYDVFSRPITETLLKIYENSSMHRERQSSSPGLDRISRFYFDQESMEPQQTNEDEPKLREDVLNIDYGEEENNGEETPTEAEPPLSSILSGTGVGKISEEQIIIGNAEYPANQQQYTIDTYPQSDPLFEQRISKQDLNSPNVANSRSKRSRSRSQSPLAYTGLSYNKVDVSYRYSKILKPPTQSKKDKSQVLPLASSKETGREPKRQRMSLPIKRARHLTVSSCTIWLGRLPKTVSEVDLFNKFSEYGVITSIDLVPPRGCAYLCMKLRRDAEKVLTESKDLKLKGSYIKMAWAPGKGLMDYKKFREFWEIETGSSFIPYSKIDETIDLDILEEGGLIDEDSMSIDMREKRVRRRKEKEMHKIHFDQTITMSGSPIMSQAPRQTSTTRFSIHQLDMSMPPSSNFGQAMMQVPPHTVPLVPSSVPGHILGNPARSNGVNVTNGSHEIESFPSHRDHQLSMAGLQMSMAEQQLNMIRTAQSVIRPPDDQQANAAQYLHMQPQALYHPQAQVFNVPIQPQPMFGTEPYLNHDNFVNPGSFYHNPPAIWMDRENFIHPANTNNPSFRHQRGSF